MSGYTNLPSSKDDNVSYDMLINLLDYGDPIRHRPGTHRWHAYLSLACCGQETTRRRMVLDSREPEQKELYIISDPVDRPLDGFFKIPPNVDFVLPAVCINDNKSSALVSGGKVTCHLDCEGHRTGPQNEYVALARLQGRPSTSLYGRG
jgi:hypothetical protein